MYQLVIGNKNYSSWSLRPWLLMKVMGIPFEEIKVNIYSEKGKQDLRTYTTAGQVPVLLVNGIKIWDSMAIVEYLAEQHPERALWPLSLTSRSIARSVANEMHSSFLHLRHNLPMNCRTQIQGLKIGQKTQRDINRVCEIWKECRSYFGTRGDFLFGNFSIADSMFAPVVLRFKSYGIEVGEQEQQYMENMLCLPQIQEWIAAGKQESTHVEALELGP